MPNTFQQRCQLALTHPVTLGAVALLLVNDWLLKPLWHSDWTTGKLSDLAWMVFFPPLLLFVLSLAARGNSRAQRVAYIAAYLGLPVLYAAHNTFAPLHDWIMGGFMVLSGASVGSPLDPFGLAGHPACDGRRALGLGHGTAHSRAGLRTRLHLYAVVIAALATVATSEGELAYRPWSLGVASEHTAVSIGGRDEMYVSEDGGYSWAAALSNPSKISWAGGSVTTPRGVYSIEGSRITLQTPEGESRVVHTVAYLKESSNYWAQKFATRERRVDFLNLGVHSDASRLINVRPLNIVYEPHFQNVIASLGMIGVLVGNADEEWLLVPVGEYGPPDFTLPGKLKLSLSIHNFAGALAITLAFIGLILALVSKHLPPMEPPIPGTLTILRGIFWALLAGAGLGIVVLLSLALLVSGLSNYIGPPWSLVMLLAAFFALLPYASKRLPRHNTWRRHFASSLASMGISLGALMSTPHLPDLYDFYFGTEPIFLSLGLFAGIAAIAVYLPNRRQLPSVAAAFVAMNVLLPLPFLLWLAGGVTLWLATLGAAALLTLTAVALYKHLVRQADSEAEGLHT